MNKILSSFRIDVNPHLYLKDPYSSELGMSILKTGILMIDAIGFEDFTFRKLGQQIHSPEASIYRYFENKHKFILYLSAWYWAWMEYKLVLELNNIASPEKRLEKAILLITDDLTREPKNFFLDLNKLYRIISIESGKSLLTKNVDVVNKEGAFLNYKQFVERVSAIITEINPNYRYPNMLVTTIVEGSHLQKFYGDHLPRLTNVQKSNDYIFKFYKDLSLNSIKKKA